MGRRRILRVLRRDSLPFTVDCLRVRVMTGTTMVDRLEPFVESVMRSCSMDFGGITPLYVYGMWGGAVAIEDIATAMEDVSRMR